MKNTLKLLAAVGVAAMLAVPGEAGAFWGGGLGPWSNNYVHDPAYRWGPPWQRSYIRDLYRYGPTYAHWRQLRRWY